MDIESIVAASWKLLALVALTIILLFAVAGCTVTTGPILSPRVSLQIGGDHTDPDVRVDNRLGDGATQDHQLPIDKTTDAAGSLTLPVK